jgi:type IV pilus assembly protein PilM
MAKGKHVVGLDIGSAAVKVCALKESKRGLVLQAFDMAELPPEAIVDGSIMDSHVVIDTIRELLKRNKIRLKNAAISVAGHSVIIKKIPLPLMTEEELEESIVWEAEQYIPFDINDVNLDYLVLESGGGDTMDVLLVAVKKDRIADYTSVIVQAGKDPVLVDVDVFALQNAFEANYDPDSETVALVNIGASVMNINVLYHGTSIFWRDVAFGGNQYTEAIQRELSLSRDDAERLKLGERIGENTLQQVLSVLNSVSEDLTAELQKTIDFFVATSSVDHLDRVVLAGGSAQVLNLDEVIRDRFQVAVEVMNPFRNIRYSESDFDPEWINRHAPAMAVAVGLAVRRVGE